MISIDKAKRLKSLGLEWNPKLGDWYKADYWPTSTLFTVIELRYIIENVRDDENNTWLPSLNQMLDEIEKYQYTFSLVGEKVTLFKKLNLVIQFECDSREDSVADALIWILENI